ncbi:hypothetical protein A6456_09280 [Paraburkholderia tropica]|nr:hypothetical protein A6456_09280 [Paraburkholderia tropica]
MLASRHRVIGIELSDQNCLGTDRQAPLTVESLAQQVRSVLERVVPNQAAILVGYSLGAGVAVEVAASWPEDVAKLVLLNGWAKTDNALRLRLALWQRLRNSEDKDALAELMLSNVYGRAFLNARSWDDIVQLRDAYVVGPGSDRQMALNMELDVCASLQKVVAPTLVIGSTYDQLIPFSYSLELVGGIENAALAEVSSGHGSVTERPAEVFRLIDQFARHEAGPANSARFEDGSLKQLAGFQS